jgi:recombination protein RecA
MKLKIFINFCILVSFVCAHQLIAQNKTEDLRSILQQKIDSLRSAADIPAMAFSCILPTGEQITVAAGMQPEQRMLAGSTGKTFFAAIALQLVANGKLALDDKAINYLGENPWYDSIQNAPTITIRMLMNHTTGLSDERVLDVPAISTGSLGLDIALGVGGIPRGRVVEIYGPESSGKTTLSMHCIAEAQKNGGLAAFIDAEHAFDKTYAGNLGIDTENLLISQPDDGEQALEITEHLIRSGAIDLIVIDSVAALVPRGELEGEMGDSQMGLQARLMSQAMRKLTGVISKTGCSCIFINQLREKIGVMFGNPETTTGGNALKFYASVRLDIRRIGQIKESADHILGNRTRVKVVKNKVAPPFKVLEFDIMYGQGISKVGEILDLGVELDIVNKSGSWFSYQDNKLGQGRDAVKQLLADNPELSDEIERKIRAKVSGKEDTKAEKEEAVVSE